MNRMNRAKALKVNGWRVFLHPLFVQQVNLLYKQVQAFQNKDPLHYHTKKEAKRLAAILHLAFEVIPQDPTRSEYRQGNTLGGTYKHWFRAKFFQQYRLFFRYHLASKTLVFVWVNDDDSKRAYESQTDAYSVFQKMLARGNPPDDWAALIKEVDSSQEPPLWLQTP